jgi:hypothetical protein
MKNLEKPCVPCGSFQLPFANFIDQFRKALVNHMMVKWFQLCSSLSSIQVYDIVERTKRQTFGGNWQ